MKRIARSAIVGHADAHMYALVERVEAYPEFLPWCRAVRVLERAPGRTVATLSVGVKGLAYELTTENANQPPSAIDLRLREGPFRHFEAQWRFDALGAEGCRVEYAMSYAFAGPLASRMLSPLFESIADTLVDAFRRRADAVYGAASR